MVLGLVIFITVVKLLGALCKPSRFCLRQESIRSWFVGSMPCQWCKTLSYAIFETRIAQQIGMQKWYTNFNHCKIELRHSLIIHETIRVIDFKVSLSQDLNIFLKKLNIAYRKHIKRLWPKSTTTDL